jgi:hypothetical protein
MRIWGVTDVLGAGRHGSIYSAHYRIRHSCRYRQWRGTLSHVQSCDSKPNDSEISQLGSRSSVSISSMASQSKSARCDGNQDRPLCSAVAPVRGAIDWNDSSRVPRPTSVLDGGRFGNETLGFQKLLQPASSSRVAAGADSDRYARIQRREFQILLLAETLSWVIPDANRCINANSPRTPLFGLCRQPNEYRRIIRLGQYRKIADEALRNFPGEFERMYGCGRPSIPSEQLLRALLLQVFHAVRSATRTLLKFSPSKFATAIALSRSVSQPQIWTVSLSPGIPRSGFERTEVADPSAHFDPTHTTVRL